MRDETRAVPASRNRVYSALLCAAFVFAGVACQRCDDGDGLHSTRCDPFDPVLARNFDREIVDECTAENIDENCSGEADERCECDNGVVEQCSDDPNAGTGNCVWGSRICGVEANGVWGPCEGAGRSSREICDGIDNDCDDAVDGEDADLMFLTFTSSVSCWTGTSTVVFGEHSHCKIGTPMCVGGVEICTQQAFPLPYEDCDPELIDDDCDGEVNEFTRQEYDPVTGERVTCGPDQEFGICERGIQICNGGEVLCRDDPDRPGIQPVYPLGEERCDGVDNTCNGVVDENIEPHECGYMACVGLETCENGHWVGCTAPVPGPEVCFDAVDNDCDGEIDEDCNCMVGAFQPCFDQVQNSPNNTDCGRGIQFCQPGGRWGSCEFFDTIPELCNLEHDDDCDPATDDTDATPGVCGFDEGECQTGLQFCLADGTWENLCRDDPDRPGIQPVWPTIEICNRLDDDCDGVPDNGIVRRNAVAMLFGVDLSGSMCPYIISYSAAYSAFVGSFAGSDHVCMIVGVPGSGNTAYTPLTSGFVSPEECANVFANLGCNGGGSEWNLDYLLDASSMMSAIPWPNKFPYIFWLGDEPHQTLQGWVASVVNQVVADVAAQTTTCLLPGCQAPACDPANGCTPGPPEVFVMEDASYEPTYAAILNNTMNVRDRFCDILLNDPIAYEECLNAWFRDVCFDP